MRRAHFHGIGHFAPGFIINLKNRPSPSGSD